MYSTEIGKLEDKDQINDGYRRSKKNDAAAPTWLQLGRQHALGIRLPTIEAHGKGQDIIVAEHRGIDMPAFSTQSTRCRVLKDRMKNTSTLTELCGTLNIHYSDMMQGILRFTRQTAADNWWLLPPFKIRHILSEAGAVHRLALRWILDPLNSGRFAIASGHIRVGRHVNGPDW